MSTLLEYKCPCCGGAIEFSSDKQKPVCPYCDTEFELDALKGYDNDLNSEQASDMSWDTNSENTWQENEDGMCVYTCKSCGGEIICDGTTAATSCPYCGNPVVMTRHLSGDLKPDYIIPFKLDKKAAKEGLKRHLKGKHFLPKVFKDENHIDEIKSIYVPFWLFDADANAQIRYKCTKTSAWSDRNYNYVKTSFYSVVRAGKLGFNTIPVDGSKKMADDLMESIEPYDFSEAVDFQTAYLAGYLADRYDVTSEESIDRANERIKRSTESVFADTVRGYATVIPENTGIQLNNSRAKYALYPVWILNTKWKDQTYMFAMNGQTGKFVGDLPMDKSAYRRWLWGLTAALSAVIYGFAALIYML